MITRFFTTLCFTIIFALPADATVKVVATIPDLASLAREVGGEFVTVECLSQPNQDPHQVHLTPAMIVKVSQADLFVVNGLDLEIGWVPAILDAARSRKTRPGGPGYVDASVRVPVIERPVGPIDRSMGDVHPHGNPHYTLDPGRCKWAAWNIANGLIRVDAAHAEQYKAGLKNLYARIDRALARAAETMKPYRGARIIVYHAKFNYLLDRLGLRVAATIEPKPGVPPSAAHMADLIVAQRNQNVRAVLIEPWNDRRIAERIASGLGARVLIPVASAGTTDGGADVIAVFERNVARLFEALRRPSP
jgi:zinc/manganese transport system substrate-binding protein